MRFYTLVLLIFMLFSCDGGPPLRLQPKFPIVKSGLPTYGYDIVNQYKHDRDAFTQGLAFHNNFLFESTGKRGFSSLRKVEIESGRILQKHKVAKDYFAEGTTVLDGKIYQLTWQSGLAFVYDQKDFRLIREFRYQGEGWGLTHDGKNLIMSDGTHVLRIISPKTFKTTRTVVVMNEDAKPLTRLNELEYVKGEIWANVWYSETIGKPNHIARIDLKDGKLLGWINLDGISPDDVSRSVENKLNGIAYDKDNDRIFVTGKNWEKLFEIKLKKQ